MNKTSYRWQASFFMKGGSTKKTDIISISIVSGVI
jgi:hypothetical protein